MQEVSLVKQDIDPAHFLLIVIVAKGRILPKQFGQIQYPFPQLRERILYLTELLWKYPPFCYNDYEKEMRRINILFDERNLLQIRTPDSEFQTEFLRFCVGIIRIPMTA